MPYNYVLKWRRGIPESISVDAYHRYPGSAQERRRPAFRIGSAQGARLLAMRPALERIAETYPRRRYGQTLRVQLDHHDGTAYRMGLAAALLARARTPLEMERGVRYVLGATDEEIWFWSSKFLDESVGARALDALALVAGLSGQRQRRRSLSGR